MENTEALAHPCFLFHFLLNTDTKPRIPIISNVKTISTEKNMLFSPVFAQVQSHKQSGHQLSFCSFTKCVFFYFGKFFLCLRQ
jgi:hypothetical protein